MPTKNFCRRCELCNYNCNDASNWSKHKKTAKHKRNEEQIIREKQEENED